MTLLMAKGPGQHRTAWPCMSSTSACREGSASLQGTSHTAQSQHFESYAQSMRKAAENRSLQTNSLLLPSSLCCSLLPTLPSFLLFFLPPSLPPSLPSFSLASFLYSFLKNSF